MLECERYVIAAVVESRAKYAEVLKANLSPSDFENEKLKLIFARVMKNWADETPKTFFDLAIEDSENASLYLELEAYSRTTQNVEHHVATLKRSATKRRFIDRLTTVRAKVNSADPTTPINFDTALGELQNAIDLKEFYSEPKNASSLVSAYLEKLENPGDKPEFVSVGYERLDYLLGGFGIKKQDVWGIAAKTGHGKSMIALNIAVRSALRGHRVLFCTIEMDAESLIQRAIADLAKVDGTRIRAGMVPKGDPRASYGLDDKDFDRIASMQRDPMTERLSNLDIYDDTSSIRDVERAVRIARYSRPYDLVVIDYLQLYTPGDDGFYRTSYDAISAVSKFVKTEIAKKHQAGVITCLQVNREGSKKASNEISQFDIRDSNQVNQDADWISVLYHPEVDDHEMRTKYPNVTKLSVMRFEKLRHGPSGGLAMFDCIGKYLRFEEIKFV